MQKGQYPGVEAVELKGRVSANKYLLLRRTVQLSLLLLFLLGPWFGIWIIKGNIASSLTLEVIPLTDPLLLLQVLLTGHSPEIQAIQGAAIVFIFYLIFGGRTFCSWVCPINMVTDFASWLRFKLGIKTSMTFPRRTRHWMLGAILLLALITGSLAWEIVNPVSLVYRGLIFGMGMAWAIVIAILLMDVFITRHGWCGHLCPVGSFYSLIGRFSLLRINAVNRDACNDCMDCYAICPESRVIKPVLNGRPESSPIIMSGQCTNCGRCIDVCSKDVFVFSSRFSNVLPTQEGSIKPREVSS